MAEDFDVEALLEAPYNAPVTNGTSSQNYKIRPEDDEKWVLSSAFHRWLSNAFVFNLIIFFPIGNTANDREAKSAKSVSAPNHAASREKGSTKNRPKDREVGIATVNESVKRDLGLGPRRSTEEGRPSVWMDRFWIRLFQTLTSLPHSLSFSAKSRYDDDQYDRHSSRRHRDDSYSPHRRTPSYHKEDRILEEADRRTVFVMQLGARIRPRDLEEFFTQAGKVREVRLIMDNKTRKHKGIAYIEFRDSSSVSLALQLNGQKLCGYPISIQPTQAEKNKSVLLSNSSSGGNSAAALVPAAAAKKINSEPQRLYVGSLHFNVNEDMLRSIFEPFGTVTRIELMRDQETGRSKVNTVWVTNLVINLRKPDFKIHLDKLLNWSLFSYLGLCICYVCLRHQCG